ncbi:MAG: hypothetical protein HYY03_07150 [Chloroflexi bacterium]|nr:hypothetical protein [Chloroflexota bacterium]
MFLEEEPSEGPIQEKPVPQEVLEDVAQFFRNSSHWIYTSKGTPSRITRDSIYHISQLQVLFEDKHFHTYTYRAVQALRGSLLESEEVETPYTRLVLVWRKSRRFVRRAIQAHVNLVSQYSTESMNKATGVYAETLVDLGLTRLGLRRVGRKVRAYRDRAWTESEHDLDFIFEDSAGRGFGVEVKNTWDYMPADELITKLDMCHFLGLRPLFIVRNRHAIQWELVRQNGGLLYVFKSKIFPRQAMATDATTRDHLD